MCFRRESRSSAESGSGIPMIHSKACFSTGLWIDCGRFGGGAGWRSRVGPSPLQPLRDSPIYPQGYSTVMTLVLASASSIRQAMLAAAGVEHRVDPASVDESAIKAAHHGDDSMLALALAQAKALETSLRSSGNWVIGGDSLVSVDGRRFDKPASRDEAAEHLRFFSDRKMRLTSAVALARSGRSTGRTPGKQSFTSDRCQTLSSTPIWRPNGPRCLIASVCSGWKGAA